MTERKAMGVRRSVLPSVYGRSKKLPGCSMFVEYDTCRRYGRYEVDGKLYCRVHAAIAKRRTP